jgi:hypothetical protein
MKRRDLDLVRPASFLVFSWLCLKFRKLQKGGNTYACLCGDLDLEIQQHTARTCTCAVLSPDTRYDTKHGTVA